MISVKPRFVSITYIECEQREVKMKLTKGDLTNGKSLGTDKIVDLRKIVDLSLLDDSYKDYIETLKTFQKTQSFSSDYIYSIISELKEYKRKFLVFDPQNGWLPNFSDLSIRTSNILIGVNDNIQAYTQMYSDKMNEEREIGQTFKEMCEYRNSKEKSRQEFARKTKEDVGNTYKGVIETSKESHTKINKKWLDAFTGTGKS
jgi:hypothetical protein